MFNEYGFEEKFEVGFLDNGWQKGNPQDYNEQHGLFVNDLMEFLKNSQAKKFEKLKNKVGENNIQDTIIKYVKEHIKSDLITNLKNIGYEKLNIKGITFDLIIDKPKSNNNPKTLEQYKQNITKIYRQTSFAVDGVSVAHNRPDVILSVNGFPLVIIELKSRFTQPIENAKKQFREDRKPSSNILYQFNKRTLLYMAVTENDICITTKLEGKNTRFLPFNRFENNKQKLNLNNETDETYQISYLWKQVFNRDSFIDIICNFIFKDEKKNLIFPRLHQWEAVTQLTQSAVKNNVNKNYLIQHSAGSGKSKSISWLAHKLASLHDENGELAIYDSVIVLVDRKILDKQLRHEITFMAKNINSVAQVKTTEELVLALNKRAKIIISTIQKFNFISDVLQNKSDINFDIKTHKFAIIIDEAHSSQGSETTKSINNTLNNNGIINAVGEFIDNDEDESDNYYGTYNTKVDRKIAEEAMARKSVQENISIFAFTATPKYKTLISFGERPKENETYFTPFHLYSMKQAIEEGFILDVLQNYTIYETYFNINKKIEDDPEMDNAKTTRAVLNYAKLHEHHISQKIDIIVEHFQENVADKINGQAKAMIVTSSREEALRYKEAFDEYLLKNQISSIKTLVAFSGELQRGDKKVSEVQINGISEDKLPEAFDSNEYQVLLVASKYQTGFDQPKLHTMYVLKPLSGVNAVQTLSRLNRTCEGKNDTCVIDFVNSKEDIYKAFKPFYEKSMTENNIDEFSLKEIRNSISEFNVFTLDDVERFSEIYYLRKKKSVEILLNTINGVLYNISQLEDEKKEDLEKQLISYTKLYSYISSLVVLENVNDAKHFAFFSFLLKAMKNASINENKIDPDTLVELADIQTKFIESMNIKLNDDEDLNIVSPSTANGKGGDEDNKQLSIIIEKINSRYKDNETTTEDIKIEIKDFVDTIKKDKKFMTIFKNNLARDNKKKLLDKYDEILINKYKSIQRKSEFLDILYQDEEINGLISDEIYQELV